MKKYCRLLLLTFVGVLTLQGCDDLDDHAVPVNDFIWKGMNLYYLWQQDVPNLADSKAANQAQLNMFLQEFSSPENLFDNLLYQKGVIDRFSVIYSDYTLLEQALTGTVKNNGVDYGLRFKNSGSTEIFGWVRYILPNSDASTKNIQRGTIFYAVNGTPLTSSNYRSLLNSEDSYTLNLADYDNGAITPNGQTVSLTKTPFSENPVYLTQTYTMGNHKIGYLVYNGFYGDYDNQLNAAFGQLAGENITDLVLDLRYNSGGLISSAVRLGSMVTGQFNGQVFNRQQWNPKIQAHLEQANSASLVNNFTNSLSNGSGINSLNLTKVYILTSQSTASASELVINCLKPYINVVQIGDVTIGKNAGSITLYDSPDFSANKRSSSHRYAMQPLVLKTVNKEGYGDYTAGIQPTYPLIENLGNLGQLGDTSEPLLSTAIGIITNSARMQKQNPTEQFRHFKDSKSINPMQTEMYIDKLPEGLGTVQP